MIFLPKKEAILSTKVFEEQVENQEEEPSAQIDDVKDSWLEATENWGFARRNKWMKKKERNEVLR